MIRDIRGALGGTVGSDFPPNLLVRGVGGGLQGTVGGSLIFSPLDVKSPPPPVRPRRAVADRNLPTPLVFQIQLAGEDKQ